MKEMRPKAAQVGRAHSLPKIHKKDTDLPSFRPIIDTTNTPHCGVGKFLTRLLNPLTQNVYSIKASFEAVDRIHSIPTELFNEGYRYFSFDVISLFTNVLLNKTINIVLHGIYKENLVKTNLRKSTLKKLIKDSCTKTAFSFDGKIYKQIDGVSMGSSLGPVLANVIMMEFERSVVGKFIKDGLIKFYIRYVDSTLVQAKAEDIDNIINSLIHLIRVFNLLLTDLKMVSYISLTSKLMVLRQTCIIKPLILYSIVISPVKHLGS